MTKTFSIVPLLVVPFIACGGGGDSHTVTIVDSHLGSGSGSNVTCEAAPSYTPAGAFGSANSFAVNSPATGSGSAATIHNEYLDGVLQGSDILDITLYAGYGGFGSGDIANGTYALTGDDADWGLCGICVDVMPGALGSDGRIDYSDPYYASHPYIATTGSITFTSTTTRLTGNLTNVTFKHFNFDRGAGTSTYPDSCTTTIASATFDDALKTGSGSGSANFTATGTAEGGLKVQFHLGNRHR
jgi:hypothetical protein